MNKKAGSSKKKAKSGANSKKAKTAAVRNQKKLELPDSSEKNSDFGSIGYQI